MTSDEIAYALHEHHFATDRSKRYHAYRLACHRFSCIAIQIINCLVSAAVLVKILDGWPLLKTVLLGSASILSGVAAYQSISKRIESHADFKARFGELKKMFPPDLTEGSKETLAQIAAAREEIEKTDTRGFPCLDILMHNEECQARGMKEAMKPLNWFQRTIGCTLIPLSYRE